MEIKEIKIILTAVGSAGITSLYWAVAIGLIPAPFVVIPTLLTMIVAVCCLIWCYKRW